jgi:hypothetical protein
MDIEIREYLEQRPHGDRASGLSPSSRFEVWGDVSGNSNWKKLNTFDCFDHHNYSVQERAPVYKEAVAYARDVGDGDNIDHVIYQPKVVTEWVREKCENVQ